MESDCDHPSEMEARLEEKHHRWLRPKEICEVLQNPNCTFTKMPEIRPPSGSIFLFNKKEQKGFRKDHYTWKKANKGRIKEGHEKLKVEGVDTLHCYYAHKEDDNNFQRRIYWLIDKNLSHIVLVHYRNVKEDQVLPSRETDASAYNHQASSGLPPVPGLQHEIPSSSSNPNNFQHPRATYATNLKSAQTSEPENTVSAYNHQASHELPHIPGLLQHEIASSIPNPSNFPHSQAIDATNMNSAQTLEPETSVSGPSFWESFDNLRNDPSFAFLIDNLSDVFPASSSAAVEPSHSSLGKRQCDATESQATPLETIEGEDEEEEGNDTNQARKRLKVTCGQKNHEQELEPTSIEPENGKSKAVVQNDFGTGKRHEFSAVMDSYKSLRELLDRVSAPNTLASSTISTPTIDLQTIATIRTTLDMDFNTMAGDDQRTEKISLIKSCLDSSCFPTDIRKMILSTLEQLEQPLLDYSKNDKRKNLNDQVEARIKRLQPTVQFCESKKGKLQELEEMKMQIEANQAAIRAEIDGAVKETEPIQAELKELLQQRDQFKETEDNLEISLAIGKLSWKTLKIIFDRHLPT